MNYTTLDRNLWKFLEEDFAQHLGFWILFLLQLFFMYSLSSKWANHLLCQNHFDIEQQRFLNIPEMSYPNATKLYIQNTICIWMSCAIHTIFLFDETQHSTVTISLTRSLTYWVVYSTVCCFVLLYYLIADIED